MTQMTLRKQYHHSDPGKHQCSSYSSLFYPLLRVCGRLVDYRIKYPHHEKRSTAPSLSAAFLQLVPREQALEAMKTLQRCHSLNKPQHQLENPSVNQVLYLKQTNKTNPQNQKKIPNFLSKEGCQCGTYYGKDMFANVFF